MSASIRLADDQPQRTSARSHEKGEWQHRAARHTREPDSRSLRPPRLDLRAVDRPASRLTPMRQPVALVSEADPANQRSAPHLMEVAVIPCEIRYCSVGPPRSHTIEERPHGGTLCELVVQTDIPRVPSREVVALPGHPRGRLPGARRTTLYHVVSAVWGRVVSMSEASRRNTKRSTDSDCEYRPIPNDPDYRAVRATTTIDHSGFSPQSRTAPPTTPRSSIGPKKHYNNYYIIGVTLVMPSDWTSAYCSHIL